MAAPPPESVERFRRDFGAAAPPRAFPAGIAVSGGPDSLALLLLAASAWPGRVRAATVDHGLRPESAEEAAYVAEICGRIGVPHRILRLDWPKPPASNVQAKARQARYAALTEWAAGEGVACIATAHHLDDQAETLLMRLARGAGLSGLAGVRSLTRMNGFPIVRPLLGWRKTELAAVVSSAGLAAIEDPANRDERFDRTRARALLAGTEWIEPERLAAAAANLAEAEEALDWVAERFWVERSAREDENVILDAGDLPREIQRRLLIRAIEAVAGAAPGRGPDVSRLLDSLRLGGGGTLAGVQARSGAKWFFNAAPPRRKGDPA